MRLATSRAMDAAKRAEARRAEALARERERETAPRSRRPLWMIPIGFLVLSFATQRAAAAAIAYHDGAPAALWLALGAECAAAAVLGVGVWIGARWAIGAAFAFGALALLSAAAQCALLGARAAPLAIARALVALLGAGGLIHLLRRHFAALDARRSGAG
jgi:hypothetical protein